MTHDSRRGPGGRPATAAAAEADPDLAKDPLAVGLADEVPLVGGMDPRWAPVRVGNTVRRPAGSQPGVAALLRHLEAVGFDGAPRHLGVDAEMALRGCNLRFRQRFRQMEAASEKPLEELQPAELETLWADAKRRLALPPSEASSSKTEPGS